MNVKSTLVSGILKIVAIVILLLSISIAWDLAVPHAFRPINVPHNRAMLRRLPGVFVYFSTDRVNPYLVGRHRQCLKWQPSSNETDELNDEACSRYLAHYEANKQSHTARCGTGRFKPGPQAPNNPSFVDSRTGQLIELVPQSGDPPVYRDQRSPDCRYSLFSTEASTINCLFFCNRQDNIYHFVIHDLETGERTRLTVDNAWYTDSLTWAAE